VEADAILSALDSRFTTVRDAAERLPRAARRGGTRGELRRTMLQHATRYPGAALRVVEEDWPASAAAQGRLARAVVWRCR
jgi:hypothetical protein